MQESIPLLRHVRAIVPPCNRPLMALDTPDQSGTSQSSAIIGGSAPTTENRSPCYQSPIMEGVGRKQAI
jgi:hypothetical protein